MHEISKGTTAYSAESTEQQMNIIPIRMALFSPQFWNLWDQLMDRERAAYTLGWIAELEMAIRRMSEQLRRIEDHLEEDEGK